ncbi:MAG: GNAT family N-acetyltransferase [Defluviitaleaceae bacterium]|nr:GNAT family N-acetyltransferase [Defluviitaleaceae bacterium]
MDFVWKDYPAQYETEIESWCDEPAIRFALDEDSVIAEHKWYLNSDKYVHNENYFCKVVLDDTTPVALFMLAVFRDEARKFLSESIVYLDTLIINPTLRNQNFGSRIIADVIQNAEQIIGSRSNIFISQIRKDNGTAIKLATRLGFHLVCTETEKNHDWFDWVYPASKADRFLAYRENSAKI